MDGFINVLVASSGILGPRINDPKSNALLSAFRYVLWATNAGNFTHAYHVNTSALFFTIITFLEFLGARNDSSNAEQKTEVITTSIIGAYTRLSIKRYAYGQAKQRFFIC